VVGQLLKLFVFYACRHVDRPLLVYTLIRKYVNFLENTRNSRKDNNLWDHLVLLLHKAQLIHKIEPYAICIC